MDKNIAIEKYFSNSLRGKGALEKLMKWDENKTINENAENLGIKFHEDARGFAARFNLGYLKRKYRGDGGSLLFTQERAKKMAQVVGLGYSYSQVGRMHGISRQRVEQIFRKYGLKP